MAKVSGLLSQILDPIFGADTAKEDAAAKEAVWKGREIYESLPTPDYGTVDYLPYSDLSTPTADLQYSLGDPSQASAFLAQDSLMKGVSADPRLKLSQDSALQALNEIIQGGGLRAQDLAAFNKIQTDTAQADRGRREAILQNFNARGMGGSGNELLAALTSGQAASDRANQAGLDIAGIASQRELDAIMQSGNLSGAMRGQDFSEQAQAAQAQDAINRFNSANITSMNQGNMAAQNQFALQQASGGFQADQLNRNNALDVQARRQQLANQNVDKSNQSSDANRELINQKFQDQITKAQGMSGALANQGNFYTGLGDRKAKKSSEYLAGAIDIGKSAANPAPVPK